MPDSATGLWLGNSATSVSRLPWLPRSCEAWKAEDRCAVPAGILDPVRSRGSPRCALCVSLWARRSSRRDISSARSWPLCADLLTSGWAHFLNFPIQVLHCRYFPSLCFCLSFSFLTRPDAHPSENRPFDELAVKAFSLPPDLSPQTRRIAFRFGSKANATLQTPSAASTAIPSCSRDGSR